MLKILWLVFFCRHSVEDCQRMSYPSIISSSKSAGLSHIGHIHVGFFSFIWRNVAASKHCRWEHVRGRHGVRIRTFPSYSEWSQHICICQACYTRPSSVRLRCVRPRRELHFLGKRCSSSKDGFQAVALNQQLNGNHNSPTMVESSISQAGTCILLNLLQATQTSSASQHWDEASTISSA